MTDSTSCIRCYIASDTKQLHTHEAVRDSLLKCSNVHDACECHKLVQRVVRQGHAGDAMGIRTLMQPVAHASGTLDARRSWIRVCTA